MLWDGHGMEPGRGVFLGDAGGWRVVWAGGAGLGRRVVGRFDGEVGLRAVAAEGWLVHREVPGWRRPDGGTAFAEGEPRQEWDEPTTGFSPLLGVPVVLAASTVYAKGAPRSVVAMHAVPGMELMNAWETGFSHAARGLTAVAVDGRCLVAARAPWEPDYRVWDAETGAEVCAWTQEHEGPIAAAGFDGEPLLLTGDGPLVRVRDPRTGAETRRPLVFEGVEEAVSISVAAGYALVAGRRRTGLYPLAGGAPLWTSDGDGPDAPVSGLGLLRGRPVALVNTPGRAEEAADLAAFARLSGPAVVLDLLTGRTVGDPLPCRASSGGFLAAGEGTLAYAALAWSRDDPGDTWVWDPEVPDDAPAWHGGPVRALVGFVLDGAEAAVSLDEDGDARLWDLGALARDPGAATAVLLGSGVGAVDVVAHGGRPAVVLGGAGFLRLVSPADGAVLAETALGADEEVTALCHTGADGTLRVLAGVAVPGPKPYGRYGAVRAWAPGSEPSPAFGQDGSAGSFRVCALAGARDGDRTVALRVGAIYNLGPERWAVEDAEFLGTIGTGGDVYAAAATALDGVAHFACTTYDGGVALSRVSDGRIVARLAGDSYGVAQTLAVSGGPRPLIASTNHFRVMSLWHAPDPSLLAPPVRLTHASLACAWTPSGRLLVGFGPGLALLEPPA
ncbi:hypothetical protein EDD29_1250 [Actinocorallia herbida]|uniref:Uncharacterized protein n=2 Tax=Actinocorallia herbida TaxID=58109 RepID=A0A3N1CR05_9ACTN|nr:hypothetical protein EDD29_1250 [Actinocorallia herbida]